MAENLENSRSFLRWAGSKRKLIPILKEYWSKDYKTYYEPFMGSAQLFFSIIDAKKFFLSDLNEDLVDTFQQLKSQPYKVYSELKKFENCESNYYRVRALDTTKLGRNQKAARFIYLNWLCFNGLYRTNNQGKFNVPYSGESKKNIYDWELLKNASKKLQNAEIIVGDFEKVIRNHLVKKSFVYLDPPYAIENQRIFTQYCNHTFGIKDIERLHDLTHFINDNGAFFLLSYANTERLSETFKYWTIREVTVQRNIAGFSKYRRKSSELLITNIE